MKKLLAVLLGIMLMVTGCMAFTGCKDSDKDKLIVYTEAGFAPWEFTADGSTEVIGVDMEIAKYIANKYDWELEIINGSFDAIVAGIAEDNALGIAGISYTADRAEDVEFSDFYWGGAYQAVVYEVSANPTLTDGAFAVSNFENAKLVYQTGTTSQITVSENATTWGVSSQNSFSQVMAALEDMKTTSDKEFLIVDSQVAAQLAANDSSIAFAAIEGMEAEQYGIVAKKGNTDLINKVNEALAELLVEDENGNNQIEKWFVQFSTAE